eukprot:TRINITY_DN11626_c0_g1_i2.p1 TRINITY_DN11626_c0_g1~~TRINITY_DN11626_c0_g1_i2.p1  ORF type:complete len:636 (+),score=161.30 TRINITY_DN11626_c0_g1_i2:1479-3386(+)
MGKMQCCWHLFPFFLDPCRDLHVHDSPATTSLHFLPCFLSTSTCRMPPPPRPPPPQSTAAPPAYSSEPTQPNEPLPAYSTTATPVTMAAPPPAAAQANLPVAQPAQAAQGAIVSTAMPQPAPVAYGVTALPKEAELVTSAMSTTLPQLQQRLNAAFRKHVALQFDPNAVLGACSTGEKRYYVANSLLKTDGLLHQLVHQIEKACSETGVQADMARRINAVVIMAADQIAVTLDPAGTMYYAMQVNQKTFAPSKTIIKQFLETNFQAEERRLLGQLTRVIVPMYNQQLNQALQHSVNIQFDPSPALATAKDAKQRIEITHLLATDVGLARSARRVGEGFESMLTKTLGSLSGSTDGKPSPQNQVQSQMFLQPLVHALIKHASSDPNNQVLRALTTIHVEAVAEGKPSLRWMLPSGQPADNLHTQQQSSQLVLHYTIVPPKMARGVFTTDAAVAQLELGTQAQERCLINAYLATALVSLQQCWSGHAGHHVQVEVDWNTIFPSSIPAEKRLPRAETMAGANGKHTSGTFVRALNELANEPNAKQAIAQVQKVILVNSNDGKPQLALTAGSLIYTLVLDKGLSGTLDVFQLKAQMRNCFQLETPKDEKGMSGAVKSFGAGLDRLGDKMAKGFGGWMKK